MDDPRPTLHAIVGLPFPGGHYLVLIDAPFTLDQAMHYRERGWQVLVDPADEAELTRYEQLQRSYQSGRKRGWRDWGV